MSKRDGQQGSGVESGTSNKQKIPRDYEARGQNEKRGTPKPHNREKIGNGFTVK